MEIIKQGEGAVVVSDAEAQIVSLLAEGERPPKIAEVQKTTAKAIEQLIWRLQKKTGCKSSAHLVATFLRNKIIE